MLFLTLILILGPHTGTLQLVLGLRSSLTYYKSPSVWSQLKTSVTFTKYKLWLGNTARLFEYLTCGQMCFHLQNRVDIWISDMWAHALADKVSIWVYRLLPECDCSLVLCDLIQPLCIAQRNTKMPSSKIRTTCQFEMHFHLALIDVSLRNIFQMSLPKLTVDLLNFNHGFWKCRSPIVIRQYYT